MRQAGEAGQGFGQTASGTPAQSGQRAAAVPVIASLVRRLEDEQERWFLWLPVALGSGIVLYFLLPFEPTLATAVLPVGAALVLWWAGGQGAMSLIAGAAALAATSGFALSKLRTESVRAPVLAASLAAQQVEGFVELVEPRAGKGQRLTLRVLKIERLDAGEQPVRVRVRTLRENRDLKPGDAVRLKAALSPPPIPALPGDYDFARTAWFARLGAVGYSTEAAQPMADAPAPPLGLAIFAAIERVRHAIGRRVTAALPGETGAIANALITGERGGISEATNQAYRDSGLFHILSISGLHMAIIAGAAFLAIRVLLAAIPAVALRHPIKKWAAVGAMLATLGYLLISGSSFATVRSYIMISIMFVAILADRPALALRNVALAALLILMAWPESLFDVGFQMSFAAVVALVSAYEWLRRREEARAGDAGLFGGALRRGGLFLAGIVLTTLIASLAVAPFGLYHFHNTQQFAILANLIAIPICNLIVMPAALATLLLLPAGLEAAPLGLMGAGIDIMTWCARNVAALPGAVGRVPAIPTPAFALTVCGGLWLTLWRTRWRIWGLVPIAGGIMLAPTGARPDVLIGRGADLVAVRTPAGLLSALPVRGGTFELTRWLEHDGDARGAAVAGKGEAWRCDESGCTARVAGLTIAVAKAPAAVRDDCRAAQIVVMRLPRTGPCTSALAVVDRTAVATRGAHALYVAREGMWGRISGMRGLHAGQLRIDTVADGRGDRPWSAAPAARDRSIDAASPPASPAPWPDDPAEKSDP